MAALPYMQFYVADHLADTAHLSAMQHGAYMLLLMNYWQRGKPLRNDSVRLANVARMSSEEWAANVTVLEEFFVVTESEWVHPRVDRDLEAVSGKSRTNSAIAKAAADARRAKAEQEASERAANAERTLGHTDTDTEQIQIKPKIKNLPADKRQAASKPEPDERHIACREHVHAAWKHRHPGEESAPWDGSESAALSRLLKAKPDLTPERFRQLLYLRECSEDTNHSERPRRWIQNLTDYAGGPLDRFGKAIQAVKVNSGATVGMNHAREPTARPVQADVDFAEWLRHRPMDDMEREWLNEFDGKWPSATEGAAVI